MKLSILMESTSTFTVGLTVPFNEFIFPIMELFQMRLDNNLRVLDVRMRDLGEEWSDTMGATRDLAVTYSNQRRGEDGTKLQERIVEVRKRVLRQHHYRVLIASVNLAMIEILTYTVIVDTFVLWFLILSFSFCV